MSPIHERNWELGAEIPRTDGRAQSVHRGLPSQAWVSASGAPCSPETAAVPIARNETTGLDDMYASGQVSAEAGKRTPSFTIVSG
jgi:hypothetical protein